ncbi:MAG: hypothetical protein JNM18_19320 [Planctomycetaceae bacterium]|nr:hypothetical protein [Planctomycetaceae bacterium]
MLTVTVSKQAQQIKRNEFAITDPTEVMQIARELADTDLLDDFKEGGASEVKLRGVNKLVFKIAKLKADDDRSMMLCQWGEDTVTNKSHDELIRDSTDLVNPAQPAAEDADSKTKPDIVIKDLTVRGKPARFQFLKVKHKPAEGEEAEYWQVSGVIAGKDGPTVLTLFLPRTDYTMEQLIADFEAIK